MSVPVLNPLESRERPVLADGERIQSGAILLSRAGIVLDLDENPEPYQDAMAMVEERLGWCLEWGEEMSNYEILSAVEAAARRHAPFDKPSYEAFLKEQATLRGVERLTNSDLVGFSHLIVKRGRLDTPIGGICQSHTMLSGALICLLQDRSILGGTTTIRSGRPSPHHPDRHTQLLFVEGDDKFTIDAASGLREARWL